MDTLIDSLTLKRSGNPAATVGMISLPLPRATANRISIRHPASALQPVGWWERGRVPRRSLGFVLGDSALPETLQLQMDAEPAPDSPSPWTVSSRISREKLDYTPHVFSQIASLRGVPAEECTIIEGELLLSYAGRTLVLQCGATGPKGGPYWWQNVQVDRLWRNPVVEAVRVGGVIHNADTYLWADVFLLLFANGMAHSAVHFVNTKLHIEGYDFQGLPVIRLAGEGLTPVTAHLPADGTDFDLGLARLNTADAGILCSTEEPGQLTPVGADQHWYPVSRTRNPQWAEAPEKEWAVGFARTVRFQISLSAAPAALARYQAPAWWYTTCGEPWPGDFLPVRGAYTPLAEQGCEYVRNSMTRGRFDGGSAAFGNDGFAGTGLMQNYYQMGQPELQTDALAYCYYWADLVVDHCDFSVHQWVGGWGWKTCAYSKFRDVLYGYLETGDPYLLDTAENCADAYWMWFRSNWPRCTIGRDAFELGGWALLWRFLRTEHARERTLELTRMLRTVLDSRGVVGGQMGAGPHPGYHSSLYMTGVCMSSLMEVMEAATEEGLTDDCAAIGDLLDRMDTHYVRDDVELFPSDLGHPRPKWQNRSHTGWATLALRVYPELGRFYGKSDRVQRGLTRIVDSSRAPFNEWVTMCRPGDSLVNPRYYDAMLLGARVRGMGLEIAPLGELTQWPAVQTVDTPWGELTISTTVGEKPSIQFKAERSFPITIRYGGKTLRSESNSKKKLKVGKDGLFVPVR